MLELLIVGSLVLVFASIASLFWMAWQTVVWLGFILCGLGFLFGVPTGVMYHVRLYEALTARNALPAGWYWRPIPLNKELSDAERSRVMPWCYAGGAGFVVIVLGMIVLGAAMVRVMATT